MKKSKLLMLALLAGFAVSCKDTFMDPDTSGWGYDYYPLAVGDYRVYNVTDIDFQNNVGDTTRFQMREVVDTTFVDQTNMLNYKIIRSIRPNEQADWTEDSVIVISKSEDMLLLTKNNTRYVKLVFPVKEGKEWLGDAYNWHKTSDGSDTSETRSDYYYSKDRYIYKDKGQPFVLGDTTYQNTVTVIQGNFIENFSNLDHRKEVYAKDVGLVYRLYNRVTYCNDSDSQTCPYGVGYKLDGNEREEVLISYGHK